jgi:8-oxo-dGTP pyrophosphatase MutT (NUDIX family)
MSSKGSSKRSKSGRSAKSGTSAGRRRDREISAGGVVLRGRETAAGGGPSVPVGAADAEVVVIVPTRRAPDGGRVLALPKGHVDPGENALQAAEREVREETGIATELIGELGEVRYWYRRSGRTIPKSVSFFLFSYAGGDTADHDDEVEEARWIGLSEAEATLTHPGEREMVQRARAHLEAGVKDR